MRFARVLVCLACLLLGSADAWACSCIMRSTAQRFERAHMVVLGKVVSVQEPKWAADGRWQPRQVTIWVDEAFKGSHPRTLTLANGNKGCELRLHARDRVLLFSGAEPVVDLCSGSMVSAPDAVLKERFKLEPSELDAYRQQIAQVLKELRALKPKAWWQFWR